MREEPTQIIKGVVAAGTIGGGATLLYVQTVIGTVGVFFGIVLTIVLTVKALKDMKWNGMLNDAKLEDIKFRQERDLPVRRRSDKVVK